MSKLTDIFCPACDRQGIESPMISEQTGYRCQVQSHRYEYMKLMSLKPRMRAYNFVEKQPTSTIVQQVWVHPEAWQALQQKYPQNLMTTICSLLTALADGDSMILEGEHVRQMAALGITKGRDIVGLAQTNIDMQKELAELRIREKALEPIMRTLGGGLQTQQMQPQPEEENASTARNLPPRVVVPEPLPDPDGDYNPLGYMQGDGAPTRPPTAAKPATPVFRGIPKPGAPTNAR